MASAGTIFVDLQANIGAFQRGMARAAKSLDRVGAKSRQIGGALTAGLTAPILGVGAAAVKMSTDFNAAMANVATLIPGNIARVKDLKSNVQSLAIETGKSTGDLAEGLFFVVSAFGDSAESADILRIAARGAAAGLATTKDQIGLLQTVMKGFNDTSAAGAQKVSDLAFQTNKLGFTTIPELANAIPRTVAFSKELGVSMEELFAVFATGTGVTGNAAEVATQLRGVLGALIKPSDKMKEAFSSLGIAGEDAGKRLIAENGFLGALQVMQRLAPSVGGTLGELLGRKEAITLALALLGAQTDTYNRKLAAMQGAAGAAEEAFREQSEGINKFGFQLSRMKQQVVVLAQNLGDQLAPILARLFPLFQSGINLVANMVRWFTQLNPAVQNFVIIGAAIASVLGPALIAIGFMASGLAAVGTAVSAAMPLLSALVSVVGAVVGAISGAGLLAMVAWAAAIAGVVVVMDLLITQWSNLKATAARVWNGVKEVIKKAVTAIIDKVFSMIPEGLRKSIKNTIGIAKVVAPAIAGEVKKKAGDVLQAGKDIGLKVTEGVREKLGNLKDTVAGMLPTIEPMFGEFASGADTAKNAVNAMNMSLAQTGETLNQNLQQVSAWNQAMTETFTGFRDFMQQTVADSFGSMIVQMSKTGDKAKVLESVITSVADNILQQAISRLIAGFFKMAVIQGTSEMNSRRIVAKSATRKVNANAASASAASASSAAASAPYPLNLPLIAAAIAGTQAAFAPLQAQALASFHKGGVFSANGSYVGSGLRSNEGFALLEDGEVIFTPEQMALLSKNGGGQMNVSIQTATLPNGTQAQRWIRDTFLPYLNELRESGVGVS
jgi:TP901 family phage tail tape measure protein